MPRRGVFKLSWEEQEKLFYDIMNERKTVMQAADEHGVMDQAIRTKVKAVAKVLGYATSQRSMTMKALRQHFTGKKPEATKDRRYRVGDTCECGALYVGHPRCSICEILIHETEHAPPCRCGTTHAIMSPVPNLCDYCYNGGPRGEIEDD